MDKIILDEMQMLQLKRFVRIEGGIKEIDVIDEILDHLACKTEELMNDDIYLPFEKAVKAAYYSFGFGGLKLMAKQYEKKMKRLAWKEFKHALPIVLQTKMVINCFFITIVLSLLTVYIETSQQSARVHEFMAIMLLATMLAFYCIQFYSSFISDKGLGDYAFDKNILMWQKKAVKIPRVDLLFFLFFPVLIFIKLNPHFYLLIFLTMSFLSLLNSLTKEETMNRMKLKFGKAT